MRSFCYYIWRGNMRALWGVWYLAQAKHLPNWKS